MVFDTILNFREKAANKDAKWCILTVFEIIWNCREKNKKIKDGKWCILMIFDTILNCRDHFETRTLSRAL